MPACVSITRNALSLSFRYSTSRVRIDVLDHIGEIAGMEGVAVVHRVAPRRAPAPARLGWLLVAASVTAATAPERHHEADEADRHQREADRLRPLVIGDTTTPKPKIDGTQFDSLGITRPDREGVDAVLDLGNRAGVDAP